MSEWTCPKPGCELDVIEHGLPLVLQHILEGTPTKSGRDFNAEESREVADRVSARLFGAQS